MPDSKRIRVEANKGVKCASRNAKIAKFYQKEVRKVKKLLLLAESFLPSSLKGHDHELLKTEQLIT